jgi:phospholipase C
VQRTAARWKGGEACAKRVLAHRVQGISRTVPTGPERGLTRRSFLLGAAGLTLSLAGGGTLARSASKLPAPGDSGLEHVIVLMLENRSFDHLLGWLPGADGKQAGLSYPDRDGSLKQTWRLTDFQGCAYSDPDHSYEGARTEFAGGRCDGWLLAGSNDVYSIGYYQPADLPFLGRAAPGWTVCDRYFSAILGPTYPNRIYQHAGVTDRILNSTATSTLPTIWDRLAAAGLSGRYYFSDVPFLAIWGSKYLSISKPFASFLADCRSGELPSVAYVDPRFLGEDQGVSNDDHPHGDVRVGEHLLNQVYTAVTQSPAWSKTLLVITFDEWGGFFDHVPPAVAPDVQPALAQRGFRVPVLLVSPFARRATVEHGVYDHTSVLRLIEWRWGLQPLSVRDAAAANLAQALDFSTRRLDAPAYSVPPILGLPCPPGGVVGESEWAELLTLARTYGFPV